MEDKASFNTSHVTLYHTCIPDRMLSLFRFNTSHVTLYPKDAAKEGYRVLWFQYISYYSLSDLGKFL